MTLYWDRCDICEKHKPTLECRLGPHIIRACINCYTTLEYAISCPAQWHVSTRHSRTDVKKSSLKEIEELLKMLE